MRALLCALLLAGCSSDPRTAVDLAADAAADRGLADLARVTDGGPADGQARDLGLGTMKGAFKLTYYWVTEESDYTGANDTPLCDVSTAVIATVPLAFAQALAIEGTGKLTDGRLLNIGGSCPCSSGMTTCYITLDQSKYPWGVGVESRPLRPFRSLAVDKSEIPYGAHVYIPEFDGVQMPSSYGFVHDGCFEADDTGGGIVGAHVDFFAAEKKNYLALDGKLNLTQVTVYLDPPRCP